MTDTITNAQLTVFFWDAFKSLGTVLFFILTYFIKGWVATQKEQGEKIEQAISDMRSLRDATQANSKAIGDMIISHTKALERMERGQKETNRELINSLKIIMDNKILVSQNTS